MRKQRGMGSEDTGREGKEGSRKEGKGEEICIRRRKELRQRGWEVTR